MCNSDSFFIVSDIGGYGTVVNQTSHWINWVSLEITSTAL